MTSPRELHGRAAGQADPDALAAALVGDPGTVTMLLGQVNEGRADVWDRIYTLLYADLHRIARSQIRKQHRTNEKSPTSLISDSWLRLAGSRLSIENRRHFLVLVARTMRFVLLDEIRTALSEKRGGDMRVFSLDEVDDPGYMARLEDLLVLDRALDDLSRVDARMAQVVEMRYFGGMGLEEVAAVLGLNERTVRRDWRKARAFLFSQLGDGHEVPPDP